MRSSAISLAVVLARLAAAQDNSSVPTINMFIDDGLDGDESYAASIVCAGASETIYAMQCTDEGSMGVGSATCGPNAEVRPPAFSSLPTYLPIPYADSTTRSSP